MLFITKKKLDRLLKEERERASKLGYRMCLVDHFGAKGFITGRDDLFQGIKEYLERRV